MNSQHPPKYSVVDKKPKMHTDSKGNVSYGPSGVRKGTGEKVYTKADVREYDFARARSEKNAAHIEKHK